MIVNKNIRSYKLNVEEFILIAKIIGLLNTSIGSKDVRDFIIMEAVNRHLTDVFNSEAFITTFPSHHFIGGNDRYTLAEKELISLGGTNISNLNNIRAQWKLHKGDLKYLENRCILMGVEASAYSECFCSVKRQYLDHVLSKDFQ